MKNNLIGMVAVSFALIAGCASGSNNREPNTAQSAKCLGNAECGADQTCQKESGAATGTCMAAAAGANGPQKSTCVGDAECGVGQICKKDSGALSGTCVKP